MNSLDDYLSRAAPPGSMRYFALLYAEPKQRDTLSALFVIDSEIRASVHAAHEVAHTRLQWWRAELDRLTNRNAQHPASQLLQTALPNSDFSPLHELLVAADMDLARMTYNSATELDAYLVRSSTALHFGGDASTRTIATWVRRVETLRDLAMDVRAGCIYWPLDELDAAGVSLDTLRANRMTDAIRALLAKECQRLDAQFQTLPISIRPLAVLAHLHRSLLRQIAKSDYDVLNQRHDVGPLKKVWTAWRAARRT
jgi:15-cis-phytoene synthase